MKKSLDNEIMKTKKKMKTIDYILDHFETLSALNLTIAAAFMVFSLGMFYSSILAGVLLSAFTLGLFSVNIFKNKIENKLLKVYNDADQKVEIFENEEDIDLQYLTEGYPQLIEKLNDQRKELIEAQSEIGQEIRQKDRLIERLIKEKELMNQKLSCILDAGITNATQNTNNNEDIINKEI